VTQTETPIPPPPTGTGEEGARNASRGEVRVKLFARTDVGQIREHNEDNFLVADLTRKTRGLLEANRAATIGPHGSLFAVCDGMGGAAAGEIASQLAVDIIYERMVDGLDDAAPASRDDIARRLVRAIEAAGLRIFQEAKLDRTRRGMGTTVTAAALVDDYIFFGQVGDSRGYILREGQLMQVTRDQSLVNQLIEAGQLTEEEAETFEHNNIILQALGTSDTVQVDLTFAELRRGDILLLCSDGLSGMVRFEEIREILRTTAEPLDACKALTERANQAGGHDNITVIVVKFDGEGLKAVSDGAEPLKYRKYMLPEEPPEHTEPNRRMQSGAGETPASGNPVAAGAPPGNDATAQHHHAPNEGSRGMQGLASTVMFQATPVPPAGPSTPQGGWAPQPAPGEGEERIDIPGTHVPAWVVVALVVGVVVLLGATAFVLLR
jgi:protein phosphatase